MPAIKRNTYRYYLSQEQAEVMQRGLAKTELSQSNLLTMIVVAGLRCLDASEWRFTPPLKFKLQDDVVSLNEPARPRTTYRRSS